MPARVIPQPINQLEGVQAQVNALARVSVEPIEAMASLSLSVASCANNSLNHVVNGALRVLGVVRGSFLSMLKSLKTYMQRQILLKFFLYVLKHPQFVPMVTYVVQTAVLKVIGKLKGRAASTKIMRLILSHTQSSNPLMWLLEALVLCPVFQRFIMDHGQRLISRFMSR